MQLQDFKSYCLKLLLLEVSHICNTAKEVRFQHYGILGKLSRNFKWKNLSKVIISYLKTIPKKKKKKPTVLKANTVMYYFNLNATGR